jgi:hypothetical protein
MYVIGALGDDGAAQCSDRAWGPPAVPMVWEDTILGMSWPRAFCDTGAAVARGAAAFLRSCSSRARNGPVGRCRSPPCV